MLETTEAAMDKYSLQTLHVAGRNAGLYDLYDPYNTK